MPYGNNKPRYIRWLIFCALVIVSVLLQNSSGGLLEIFGARVFLCIPLCISIAMFEREVPAALFGVFAGLLWDVSSSVDSFNTLVLMVLCAVCSLLISHLMRNNIVTALVLSAGGITAYEIVYFLTRFWGGGNPVMQILKFYLPSLVLTALFIPVCYYIIKGIYNSYRIAE